LLESSIAHVHDETVLLVEVVEPLVKLAPGPPPPGGWETTEPISERRVRCSRLELATDFFIEMFDFASDSDGAI
jgi:hypothetical protein